MPTSVSAEWLLNITLKEQRIDNMAILTYWCGIYTNPNSGVRKIIRGYNLILENCIEYPQRN